LKYALATASSGIIGNVSFFSDVRMAARALADFVKGMNVEQDDAALYGPDGLLVNMKNFLDEHDEYAGNDQEVIESIVDSKDSRPIYLIGNPEHRLGFRVASPDDPSGYTNPAEAVSLLAQMRMDHGCHLKLFRVVEVTEPITSLKEIERYNVEACVEDFHSALVKEYLE